jgi:hypothetical protein
MVRQFRSRLAVLEAIVAVGPRTEVDWVDGFFLMPAVQCLVMPRDDIPPPAIIRWYPVTRVSRMGWENNSEDDVDDGRERF